MNVGIVAALKKLVEFEHVGLDYLVFFGILYAMWPWLSKEHLLAQLSVVGQLHSTTEVSLFDVIQNLDSAVEEVLQLHVTWLAPQA
jgi:hypothetical protein